MYARDGFLWIPGNIQFRWEKSVASPTPTGTVSEVGWGTPVSTTNIQVLGVDEADSVKTDGKNIYTYSEEAREIRVVSTTDLSLQNTIKLPDTFSSVSLYLSNSKLIVVGSKYVTSGSYWTARWYAPEVKTIVAVYRVSDPMKPTLERYNQIDGNYRDSRVIGDMLYLVSTSDLRLPPIYMTQYAKNANGFAQSISAVEKDFSLKNLVPEIRESYLGIKGKYISNIRASVASCKDVTFVLPDANTLKNMDFTPSFVSLSSLDTRDPTAKMKSELVFGDVSQIHMSQTSLYITSTISQTSGGSPCPPYAKCRAPSYTTESSTLIHRYALSNWGLSYKYTTSIAGNPMNQYSMDEDASGNFRIVTQSYSWSSGDSQNSTQVSVISPSGKVIGKLSNIAPGENFQSSRFIADRLYLVTFEQIDPLFVISLSDPKKPKILGELKIPGYSTYLHPYGTDRLIGLGYDTKTNQWWGVQNGGIKVDLYNVADVKNPKQEATLILWDAGSSADALSNPRAFVWYKEKNLLLLPATLMKSANDKNDLYRSQSAFQWVVGVSIMPSSINEKFRITHIALDGDFEKKWKEDCAQYVVPPSLVVCQRLLDGSEYCPPSTQYVPPYCYAGSTIDTYFALQMWNYSRDFVSRVLYVGDVFYSVAEGGIKSWNFANTASPKASVSFSSNPVNPRIYPVPMMAK
jgi:inhibitor of cysteine peptidase